MRDVATDSVTWIGPATILSDIVPNRGMPLRTSGRVRESPRCPTTIAIEAITTGPHKAEPAVSARGIGTLCRSARSLWPRCQRASDHEREGGGLDVPRVTTHLGVVAKNEAVSGWGRGRSRREVAQVVD